MCKFGFNFLKLYFNLLRIRGKVKLYRGKVDLTLTRHGYSKFYFLKFKLIHRHQCYLYFTTKNITGISCLEHKTQISATCDSSGPAHTSH